MKLKSLIIGISLSLANYNTTNAQCNTNILEAFGSTSAITLYNTYITIGSVADGYVSEVYESDYVVTLMIEQEGMIDILAVTLQTCIDDTSEGHLNEDDKDYVENLILALDFLKDEAIGLSRYAETNSNEALEEYNTKHDLAWNLIAELLGIE